MPGGGPNQSPGNRVELDAQDRREDVRFLGGEESAERPERLRRPEASRQVCPKGIAQLRHYRGGLQSVACCVVDDQRDPTSLQFERVVPIPAYLASLASWAVTGRDLYEVGVR
jgi:hypothetical protein